MAITSTIRLRMSAKDAHYGGNLVDGAHMVHLFGDVATELLIKCDGDEGLFCAYDNIEFLAPVYAGDYIEVYGEIERIGGAQSRCCPPGYQRFCGRLPRRTHRRLPCAWHLRYAEELPAHFSRQIRNGLH